MITYFEANLSFIIYHLTYLNFLTNFFNQLTLNQECHILMIRFLLTYIFKKEYFYLLRYI